MAAAYKYYLFLLLILICGNLKSQQDSRFYFYDLVNGFKENLDQELPGYDELPIEVLLTQLEEKLFQDGEGRRPPAPRPRQGHQGPQSPVARCPRRRPG